MVTGLRDIIPEFEGGPWSWFGPRMLIHLNSNPAVGELFPGEMQRCKPALFTGAKHSFSWDKNITFFNYCLQKAPKPETQVKQNKRLAAARIKFFRFCVYMASIPEEH